MALVLNNMKSVKKDYGRLSEGTHFSRIVQIVDLGVQPMTDWKTGEVKDPAPRVMFTFEVGSERIDIENEDGTTTNRPRWIQKEYTASNHEKATLSAVVATLKSDAVSLAELLDMPVMIAVGSTSSGNAKVLQVMRVPAGVSVPPLENPPVAFDFGTPDKTSFDMLPKWIQGKIKEAGNYQDIASIVDLETI
jgi:hypothetical protein